jgi:hypothetical protein
MAPLADLAPYDAPLWPAGHLPLKGGDRMSRRFSPITNLVKKEPSAKLPISPLEGEMSGKTEGRATERDVRRLARFITP